MRVLQCVQKVCKKIFTLDDQNITYMNYDVKSSKSRNASMDKNGILPSTKSRSSSTPVRLSTQSWETSGRKHMKRKSIFGESALRNSQTREPTEKNRFHKRKSIKSAAVTNNRNGEDPVKTHWANKGANVFYVSTAEDTVRNQWANKRANVYSVSTAEDPVRNQWADKQTNVSVSTAEDPVRKHWANKGANVYSVSTAASGSTRYWVRRELRYVILLPTNTRRKKSSEPPKPEPTPPSSTLEPTPSPPPSPPKTATFDLEDSFLDDLGDLSSDDSFVPRSQAKPPKPKKGGKWCCAKKQTSDTS